jgi:putative hydroxymethylpyrimidine transport system substrate-binding protein
MKEVTSMRFALCLIALMALSRPALSQEKLTVLLDWFVNPDHAALIVAKERGMFAKAGLEVELIAPADPSAPPRLVASGQGDLAITYQPQLHVQVDNGLPLVRVATLAETPLNALVALADGPVGKIADLKGKTIGFSVGGFEDALLATMLKSSGLSLDDVRLVNVNFALSSSLIAGKVDAVIGAFRNFELNQLALEGHEAVAFFPEEHGVPVYDELILVCRRGREQDGAIAAFVSVVEEATLWLTNHPREAWSLFAGSAPDLDNELNRRAWEDTLPRLAKRPAAIDVPRYERFARYMNESGLIEKLVPVEQYTAVPGMR